MIPFSEMELRRAAAYRRAHTCRECRRVTDSKTRPGNEHWPYCSHATIEQKSAWARRSELRALRTIEPIRRPGSPTAEPTI